jgi:phosphatidylinositol 3-kinase
VSFAGYSVISYILGLGDRHLENILMISCPWNPELHGRLVHIDFNRILDAEPKGKPHPEMRLPRDLMDWLGDSTNLFVMWAVNFFQHLRKLQPTVAAVLENLVSIGGLPQDRRTANAIKRMVVDKFRSDLPLGSGAQASDHIYEVIQKSSDTVKSSIVDLIHKLKN